MLGISALFLIAPKNAWACYGASCAGLDSKAEGCEADSRSVGFINVVSCTDPTECRLLKGIYLGTIEQYYSPTCNATWARVYGMIIPPAGTFGFVALDVYGTWSSQHTNQRITTISGGFAKTMMTEGAAEDACAEIRYVALSPPFAETRGKTCLSAK